jgi:hypothetical protein
MLLFYISIHFILDFFENIQETNDVSSKSNNLNVTDTNVVLETPQKGPPKNVSKITSFAGKPESIKRHRFISFTCNIKISQEYRQGNQVVHSGIQFRDIAGGAKEHYLVNGSHSKSRFSVQKSNCSYFCGYH